MSYARAYVKRNAKPPWEPRSKEVSSSSANPTKRRLSPSDVADRLAKGLCFRCDEPYTPGHRCQKLFSLGVVQEEEESEVEPMDEESTPPPLSLNAISGGASSSTVEFIGYVHHNPINILLDSGSAHNFLDQLLAQQLNLTIEPTPNMRVLVAHGESLHCAGKALQVPLKLGPTLFFIDFLILPFPKLEAIVGVSWLQTLGPITLDFSRLHMSFLHMSQLLLLKGRNPSPSQLRSLILSTHPFT